MMSCASHLRGAEARETSGCVRAVHAACVYLWIILQDFFFFWFALSTLHYPIQLKKSFGTGLISLKHIITKHWHEKCVSLLPRSIFPLNKFCWFVIIVILLSHFSCSDSKLWLLPADQGLLVTILYSLFTDVYLEGSGCEEQVQRNTSLMSHQIKYVTENFYFLLLSKTFTKTSQVWLHSWLSDACAA